MLKHKAMDFDVSHGWLTCIVCVFDDSPLVKDSAYFFCNELITFRMIYRLYMSKATIPLYGLSRPVILCIETFLCSKNL